MLYGEFWFRTMKFSTLSPLALLGALCVSAISYPFTPALQQAMENPVESAELTSLVRTLHQSKSLGAYAALKRFAEKNVAEPVGPRAALALGQYDYSNNRSESATTWLAIAAKDPLLADYAQFWLAQAERALGKNPAAVARLEKWRTDFPRSVLAGEANEALALAALVAGQPEKTIERLAGNRAARPELLLARGQAYEKIGQQARAAQDYNSIYYRFPLASEANIVAPRITALHATLKKEFPAVPAEHVQQRVQEFLDAKRCSEARSELRRLTAALTPVARDVLQVRLAACVRRGAAPPSAFTKLKITNGEADAERLYLLSQAQRSKRAAKAMLAAVEEVALRYPASSWTERALFQAGNYYWMQYDHGRAVTYYQRLCQAFPDTENGHTGHWRVAWQAYLANASRARAGMEEHLRRFPGSPHSANALYWLGRIAERENQRPDARSFYAKAVQRFPQTYYGQRSADRLRELGAGETVTLEILAAIPDADPAIALDGKPEAAVQQRITRAEARAQVLAMLDLDAEAERELVTAFRETRARGLLLAAAQLAHDFSRYYDGILLGRRLVPQLDARRMPDVPEEIWRTVYPYVYGDGIQATSEMAGLDPMLVAGLVRQESVFQASAVSRAGAIGLMQVLPGTGRQLARQLRLSYAKKKLFQPEFNLRLGTTHLARLVRQYDSVEAALAAYNAGEGRVAQWRAGRTFSEPAEFVESIPITETREYVQIVLRNREIYRSLYGTPATASAPAGSSLR